MKIYGQTYKWAHAKTDIYVFNYLIYGVIFNETSSKQMLGHIINMCVYIYILFRIKYMYKYLQPLFSSFILHTHIVYIATSALLHYSTRVAVVHLYYSMDNNMLCASICMFVYWLFNLLTGRVKRKNVPLYYIKYKLPGCRTHPPDWLYILNDFQ